MSEEMYMPGLNADTGEQGYKVMESALAVVSSYDEHERPVQWSFRDHAELILKGSVAQGRIGTYDQRRLNDKEYSIRNEVVRLICGRWDSTDVIDGDSNKSGWFCLDEDGDRRNLNRNWVVFIAVPERTVLYNNYGPYACLRVKSSAVDGPRQVSLRANDAGWLDTASPINPMLLDGFIHAYSSLSDARYAVRELEQALRTLYSWAKSHAGPDDSESAELDEHERRIARLTRAEALL